MPHISLILLESGIECSVFAALYPIRPFRSPPGGIFQTADVLFQPLIFRNFGVILHLFDSIPGRKISLLYFDIFLIDRQNVVDTPIEKSPVVRDEDKGYVGHKAAKMMSRSKSIENRKIKAAEEKRQLLKNVESQKELKILPLVFHSDPVAELRNVSVDYGTGQAVCSGVSFSVRQGERIALKGKNGSGKIGRAHV